MVAPRSRGLFVLDIHMHELSGFGVWERGGADHLHHRRDDATTRSRIEESGAAGHLQKPFDERTLLDTIRSADAANGAARAARLVVEVHPGDDGKPGCPACEE